MTMTLSKILFFFRIVKMHFARLEYRYYLACKTVWTKMHGCLFAIHSLLLRINKRTRFKLFQNVTFSLMFKVFELCNFCFERCIHFLVSAHELNERYAFTLNRRKF